MNEKISEKCRYGYARVSSKSQEENSSLEFQKQELLAQGVLEENIRVEVKSASGSMENRPIFKHLIECELKKG